MAIALCHPAFAASGGIGAIIVHGKWGNPGGNMAPLTSALESAGILVAAPEMPWSGSRLYDDTVEAADAQVDAEVAKLRGRGVKHVFIIGQSLGSAFSIHYATRATVTGVIAIAPAHRPEADRFREVFADDVRRARELAEAGKNDERIGFTDLNQGRRRYLRVPVRPFLSYFDPSGPLNMARNVELIKPEVPVFWLVPTGEPQPGRDGVVTLYQKLPKNPATRFAEPQADHFAAQGVAAAVVVDWIREIAAKD